MKKRTRLLALLLACLCLLSLVGCGNSGKVDGEKDDEPAKTPEYTAATTDNNVYRSEWNEFLRAVRGERKAENPPEQAIVSTLLMYSQMESAETGKEVDIRQLAAKYGYHY